MRTILLTVFNTFLILLTVSINMSAQTKFIISGQIIDKDDTEPLIGVNVVEIDKDGRFISGTTTDLDGNFALAVSNRNATVQVSYLGYATQVFELAGRNKLNVTLEQESIRMEEVVVTADKLGNDGIISIRDRATAVSRLEMVEMNELMTSSVEEMLMGRLGGVDIAAISGDPGAGVNIRIRGTASLNARNEPLILVNSIPYDANIDDNFDFGTADVERFGNLIDVAPEDIESIEVLKDAASTAIWGSKAANGVLSIKTKRGFKSSPIFSYTFKITRSEEPDPIPMLNGYEYPKLVTEAHYNRTLPNDPSYLPDPEDKNYAQNTNWIEEITRIAYTLNNNFSVRGGGDKTRYDVSAGYMSQEGTVISTKLDRINLRAALDYDLSNKIRLKTDIMFTRYDQDATYDWDNWDYKHTNDDGTDFDKTVRTIAYKKMPNMSVYERDTANNILGNYFTPANTIQGNAKEMYNPVAFANLGKHNRTQDNTRALFNIKYQIIENLVFESTITMDFFDQKRKKFLPYKAIGYSIDDDISNQANEEFLKKNNLQTINQLYYSTSIKGRHEISALLRLRTEDESSKRYNIKTSRSASPFLQEATGNVDIVSLESASSTFRSLSTYGQLHYKFDDKYIVTLGLNFEGTSKFSKDSRWGTFPSVSVAWRINKEPIINQIRAINDLKLRYSWGVSGNTPWGNYLYFNSYEAKSDFSYNGIAGVRPEGIELTSLKWENIEQINPGLTLSAFNYRMTLEADYYIKTTSDLYLDRFNIPTYTGYAKIARNSGIMENRGWEILTNITFVKKEKLNIQATFNMSSNENIVIQMPENYSLEYGNMLNNGNYNINIEPGNSIGGFYGYEYLGVYKDNTELVALDINGNQIYDIGDIPLEMIHGSGYVFQQGDAKYKDQNYDGVIDELDLVYLGDLNPDLMGGFGPRVSYITKIGEFVVNGFMYFKLGQKIINQTRMDTENMYFDDNQSVAVNYRWRRPGDETDMPRALNLDGYNWMGSDRFVEDGSFLRLKTTSFSYIPSDKICKRLNLKELRIYTTAYNLFTWTEYLGQDPDVAQPSDPKILPKDNSRTPPSKQIIVGLNITF
jgi:TonB-linked SusC/RagA family outer membrane protein